jgi:hypothetical protein
MISLASRRFPLQAPLAGLGSPLFMRTVATSAIYSKQPERAAWDTCVSMIGRAFEIQSNPGHAM